MASDTMDGGGSPEKESEHPAIKEAHRIVEEAEKLAEVPDPAFEKLEEISGIIDGLKDPNLSNEELNELARRMREIFGNAKQGIAMSRKIQAGIQDPDTGDGDDDDGGDGK